MTTFHYSFHFERCPSQQQLFYARRVVLEQPISDLSCNSNWGRENMVVFIDSKTQFNHLSTQHNLLHNYDIFENTRPNLHLSLISLVFLFLVIFLGRITSLLFLYKILRGWVL